MKKINIPLLNKGKLKIALAIIGIAIGLLFTSVFVFDKINQDKKISQPTFAQNCGVGTFIWHNCTACYKVVSCGGSLLYDCGSVCLLTSCGPSACSCDGVCNVSTPAGYQTTNNSCSTTSVNGTHDCGQSCSVTFYRERYVIDLTENGGTGTNCKDYTTTTGPCGGTANTAFGCTRSGYTLSSYSQTGCGGTWNSSTGVCSSVTATLNVTANWTANTYYVYYDANGGTGAPPTTSFVYNSTAYISSTIPTRTGYNFVNWTYSTYTFNPGDQIPIGWGTFTLTAQWTIKTFSVGYALNPTAGGAYTAPATRPQTINYGSPTPTATVSTNTGYTWDTFSQSGCGGTFTASTGVCSSVTAAMTITANWNINVTVNANSGTCTNDDHTRTPGAASLAPGCTRTGYTLTNYTLTAGTCGGTFTASTGVCSSVTTPITVTANWTINTYDVLFNANGGSCTNQYNINYGVASAAASCSRLGHTISSYTLTAGSCGGTFSTSTGICSSMTQDLTVQANWTINTFSVAYALNPTTGGAYTAPTTRPQTINYGSPTPTATVSTNAGYTWNTFSQSGCGGTFTASTGVCSSVTAAMTITANWNINVTINANSGTCTNDDHTRTPGAASLAPGCTRTGYTLTNYTLTAGTCGGTFTAATGVCSSVTAPITVTANWLADTFQVTVDATGGSCNPGTHNVNNGSASSAQSCTRTGYTLAGFTQTGCGGTFNTSTGVCSSVTQAMSITASWTAINYNVSYTKNISAAGTINTTNPSPVPYGTPSPTVSYDTNTGYTFVNFSITSGICGGTFTASTGVCSSVTGDLTIQANWSIHVSYTENIGAAGSLSPTYRDVGYGASATGPTVTTNTGYVFVNFSITSGSCAGTFTPSTGTCSNVQVPITIQANWNIRVSYTENIGAAGSLSPTYRDVGYGASATGPTVSTNTGYVFVNFSITSGSCAGTFTASTGTCSNVQVPITIRANWNIRVSYTENIGAAGSLSPTYRDVAYGASATGPTVSTNTGYTFVNFSITSGSCAGTFTASTGTCDNVQAPITIQANWILNTYQVTVDPSGGSCSPGTHSVNHGSASSSQSCSRTGYTLSGFTQSGCGGTFNTTTGVCSSVTQAMSITANWTLNTYQVTVNANGGSCDPGTHTVDHGNQSLAQTCSRGGYTFSGFTQSGCGGSFNTSTGECSSVTSAMTITATWSNIAPAFSATPYEAVASYSTSPTSIGSSITFRATATDANANYYLIICSTNSVTPGASGAAPSCGSTKYCNSSSTASGSQASCSYTTNSGDAWSNAWYAFVCDNNSADPKCSSANQGSGDSGSPFYVNHPPTFSDISITDSSQNPTESVQWNATASDPDGNTVKLLVCKTNAMSSGSCTGGAWCTSSLSTSNPSCSYTIPTPTPDGSYDAWVYVVDQFNLGASGTGTKQGSESDFTVNNVAPVVSSVALNSGNAILLNENTTTQIQLSATVTDANGCGSEIPSVLGYVYRSGISFTGCDTLAEANQNYCYPEITCSENSGTCSGSTDSSAVYTCNVAFNYYADPTDNDTEYPSQNWLASVKATDNNGATQRTELSTGVELNSLPACEATPNIDYGSLKIEMIISPLSIISTISSTGNVGINHNISGSNMCTNYPACTWGTPIAVTRQRYSLNSSTIYPSGTILTSTPTFIATKLPKQRTSTKETVDIWWGISIPTGIIAGDYNGEVFLTPIKSDVADW